VLDLGVARLVCPGGRVECELQRIISGVSSTISWSAGGRSGYPAERRAVSRGMRFRRVPLRVGSLWEVCRVWMAISLWLLIVRSMYFFWRVVSRSWIGVVFVSR
jgi:hypothetical protein